MKLLTFKNFRLAALISLSFISGYGLCTYLEIHVKAENLKVPPECVSVFNYCVTTGKENERLKKQNDEHIEEAKRKEEVGICE